MIKMMMCREATRLMSKRLDTTLSLGERFSLRFHLGMCHACRHCNAQFDLLHQAGRRFDDEPPADEGDDTSTRR
ncbi:MAG: zf-HC2 domain-containing protein [Onishia taeanensis]|uniref:zf-HC2 domain-containing protein n=1 Tax=Onishia taeanensis TaxID=284577 RepID=UPI003C7985CE